MWYIYICVYKRKYIYQRKKNISVAKVNFTGLTSYSGKGMGEDFCGIKHYFSRIHLICMLQVLFITVQVMCSKWRINFNTFYIQYIPLEISWLRKIHSQSIWLNPSEGRPRKICLRNYTKFRILRCSFVVLPGCFIL